MSHHEFRLTNVVSDAKGPTPYAAMKTEEL